MTINRRQSLAALFAVAATPVLAQTVQVPVNAGWADVDAAAQKLLQAKVTPGVQVSVRKQGRTVYSKAFGTANLEDWTPLTPQSICKIGSVTKQFTSCLILLLAQDGRLGLDDTLAKYFPDHPRASDVTLRQMLSHTSGLGNYTNGPPGPTRQMMRTDYDTVGLLALMKTGRTQVFEPGTAYAYSNTAYLLLGLIAEKVAGKSYAEQARERLFGPLGLTRTAVDDMAEVIPGRAGGYSNDPKAPGGFANASFISMTVPGGAGFMRSTCDDLCAWHAALLGGRVLKPEMLTAMLTPGLTNDGALPKGSGGREIRYGFGQQLFDAEGRKTVAHGGGINGFMSDLRTYPDAGVTIAHIFNTDGGAIPIPSQLGLIGIFRKTLTTAALAAA